jgi:hypothetical protein
VGHGDRFIVPSFCVRVRYLVTKPLPVIPN